MATIIPILNMSQYKKVVDHVVWNGKPSSPRGKKTLDNGMTIVEVADPARCLAVGVGRGLSPRVAAVEALQLIGGFHDRDMMLWASPNFEQFMDWGAGGEYFHGAYGRRIGNQLLEIEQKLRNDPSTRQAVATLWDPELDNEKDRSDYPCTVALGYRIKDGRLDAWTFMRSNDVWLGFPYDVFQFTQVQLSLAAALNVKVGTYSHVAASLHIYEEHLEVAETLSKPDMESWSRRFQPQGLGNWEDGFYYPKRVAEAIGTNETGYSPATETEKWYVEQLSGYFTAKSGRDVAGGR